MFKRYQQIHFVGIGGSGMSGIAEILVNLGYRVTGSDQRRNDAVERLATLGAKVFIGHRAEHVEGAHVVVYSSAVSRDNVEVQAARQHDVAVQPVLLQREGGKAHPNLERDPRLLRQHRDRAIAPGGRDQRAKGGDHLGIAPRVVVGEPETARARVRLIPVGKPATAAGAPPQ